MEAKQHNIVTDFLTSLIAIRKTERLWHIPLLASLCVGIPLLVGLYYQNLDLGITACTSGLVILYLPAGTLATRMITMLACSFGFMASYTIGILFSFHPVLSALMLGLFTFSVQWIANFFAIKPPGSFFFIMIATIASCQPFDIDSIPEKVGVIGMATMLACILAFIYSVYISRKYPFRQEVPAPKRDRYHNTIESGITGIFIGLSLLVANLFTLNNPYWVPISCLAVIQGVTLTHIWQRSLQRIIGTLLGLGLTWLILLQPLTPLVIVILIIILQFIIEMLIVRQYGLAVVFITPLTIFLAEASSTMTVSPGQLIPARLMDIALGSMIGAVAGWFIHHEQLRDKAARQIRKTRVAILRK